MKTEPLQLHISEPIGRVSAACMIPEHPTAVMTLAHGAGAGMNHPFMIGLAKALAQHGMATLRFNFPYMEKRKGRPDVPAIAHQTIACAVQHAIEMFPTLPFFASGKSFGGRMSSQWLSASQPPNVKGIVFFGFPLHPAGKPSTERAQHLFQLSLPMLFLQGTRDNLAQWDLLEEVTEKISSATLMKFEGADHAFKKGKENLLPRLAQQTAAWILSTK